MKIETQKNAEHAEIGALLTDCKVVMFTQHGAAGALRSRPMTPLELDADGTLWFLADRQSFNGDDLTTVNVSAADPEHGVFLSLAGAAALVTDVERARQLWSAFALPWFPEGPASASLGVLSVRITHAEIWEGPHSKSARILAMAASVAARRPVGLGRHRMVTS